MEAMPVRMAVGRAVFAAAGCIALIATVLSGVGSAAEQVQPFGACTVGTTTVTNVMGGQHWRPLTASKWQFPGDQVILAERGDNPGPPRRPFEYATLTSGPEFATVQIDAEVRIDEPVTRNDRDVVILFGFRSNTEFYYTHLSQDNTIYPHNGIFVVNNADRLRIDHQWNGSIGAEPSIRDTEWHRIRVRHCVETGEIAVYVDDLERPRMTATDKTFDSGRVGFGSFDNFGRLRGLTLTGTDERHVCGGRVPTMLGTDGPNALVGTPGDDVINGLGGRDAIVGQGGDDVVCGGGDPDAISGGPGDDALFGGAGRDAISGGSGDDLVYGGSDRDAVSGGSGDDTVEQEGPER